MKASIRKNEIKFRGDNQYPWIAPWASGLKWLLKREKELHKNGREGKKSILRIKKTTKLERNMF